MVESCRVFLDKSPDQVVWIWCCKNISTIAVLSIDEVDNQLTLRQQGFFSCAHYGRLQVVTTIWSVRQLTNQLTNLPCHRQHRPCRQGAVEASLGKVEQAARRGAGGQGRLGRSCKRQPWVEGWVLVLQFCCKTNCIAKNGPKIANVVNNKSTGSLRAQSWTAGSFGSKMDFVAPLVFCVLSYIQMNSKWRNLPI